MTSTTEPRLHHKYYAMLPVQEAFSQYCGSREFALISAKGQEMMIAVRFLKGAKRSNIASALKCSGVLDNPHLFNLYISVARYTQKTGLTFLGDPDRHVKMGVWRETGHSHISSYDFFIDIDCPDERLMPVALDDAKKCIKILSDVGFPVKCVFSGSGFHVIVPGEWIIWGSHSFDPMQHGNAYQVAREMALLLKTHVSGFIDTAIYDDKRLRKLPGSIAHYPEDESFFSREFPSMEALDNFHLDDYLVNVAYPSAISPPGGYSQGCYLSSSVIQSVYFDGALAKLRRRLQG